VKSIEAKVFYLKMRGDYNRYMCEFVSNTGESHVFVETARSSYEEADNFARNNMASTNPIRLGLHLNISVFYYEILNKHERAIELANRAF
jgi:14-3-3 protein epsilon